MRTRKNMTIDPFMSMLGRFRSRFDREVLASTIAHWQPRVGLRQGRQAPVIRDLVYGEHPRHRMDVFPIAGSNAPMVLFIHGGEFIGGDKSIADPFYSNVGRYFASHGMVCACMNYRLAPAGGWLAAPEDLESAARWLLDRGDLYGGDTRRLVVVGQSTGACHVATWLLSPRFASGAREATTAAVLMSGFYLAEPPLTPGQRAYFGDDASLYRERSPLAMLRQVPQRLLVTLAEWDPPALRAQSTTFADGLRSLGTDVETADLPNHNHVSPLMSLGSDSDVVGAALRRFIEHATSELPDAPNR
jgi:acetyl esterase/lipase